MPFPFDDLLSLRHRVQGDGREALGVLPPSRSRDHGGPRGARQPNFPVTARKVTLSVVSRRRAESRRAAFQSTS